MRKLFISASIAAALLSLSVPALAKGFNRDWHKPRLVITNPYDDARGRLFKGNTHSHTTNSTDGKNTPAEVMSFFRDVGYDFNAITDHEFVTDDPGVKGVLFIKGTEDGLGATGRDHMVKLGSSVTATLLDDNQESIDVALSQNNYIQINHPDGAMDWPLSKILSTSGQHSLVIWNGQRALEYASQVDEVLNNGRRLNIIVEEDLHDISAPTSGLQAVHVWANRLTAPNIIASLKAGRYFSTYTPAGQKEQDVVVRQAGKRITVLSNQPSTFVWYGKGKAMRTDENARSATYTIEGDEKYVRCRIMGAGGSVAWTNPIFIDQRDYASGKDNPRKGERE
jgi:hypothetical protein